MRKRRFPRLAYVRQLQKLYDELGDWRYVYGREATEAWWLRPSWRLDERLADLSRIQHDLSVAINHLHELTDLS